MDVNTDQRQELDIDESRMVLKEAKPPKKRAWARIFIVAAFVLVILFAFIWEIMGSNGMTRSVGSRLSGQRREERVDDPPKARSEIQDLLSSLDWVTPAFLPINEYSRPGTLIKKVNAIVIHYVGNPGTTARQNRKYFANLELTGETYASSNFIIGLDGEIIQCIPVDEVAYASNSRNADTLSIELCHPDETGKFAEETYESAVRLTAWLCEQYGLDSDCIIRHYDVTGKECPKYFTDHEEAWEAFKADVANELAADPNE